ncbi:TonB-dependent receptor [Oligella sp. HMSC05A10]|uniref:TonB-dependent receptor n=1 Tax=Oligella sp. HMSC05A10 TaxID=1581112 RepID=UPI0008A2EBD2|nr:TonB-dependent siderophore receptor [Oligella sp. HMSC05A10]OFS88804.1 TonB-dependent receptor [Oligella sp. HMSC05A10]
MSTKFDLNKPITQTVLFSAMSAALGSGIALAQEQGNVQQLPSLNVEASAASNYQVTRAQSRKMTAPLVDTPRTVNVVTEELMKDRAATSLQDVLRTTPGVTLGSGEGGTPTGDRPFIRGYEASTDIFIDGARDYARGSHETFNLESVEVVKGPSSAYTGRGGTGGSINLVTKKPHLNNAIEGGVTYGNRGQHRLTFDGNAVLTDSIAFRLNAMRMGGQVPGRGPVKYDRWGIAPSIAFGLGTPTRAILSYSHIENNDTPDFGIPYQNFRQPDMSEPLKPNRSNYYGRYGADFRKNIFDTATIELEHDINDSFTVRNLTRYGRSLNKYLYTRPSFDNCGSMRRGKLAPGPKAHLASCRSLDDNLMFRRDDRARWRLAESLINQTDIYGEFKTGSVEHSISAGFEFAKEDIYNRDTSKVKIGRSHDNFWQPNPHQDWGHVNKSFGDKSKAGDIKTKSVYLFDTIKFNPNWLVNAGVRFDNFRVYDAINNQRADHNIVSWQAALIYKPVEYGSIYFSYASSANPPGENLGQAGGADGPAGAAKIYDDLKPERAHSYELGTKWDLLNERLSVAAAIFETRKNNARSSDLDGSVQNIGKNRVRGVELSFNGSITDKWNIAAGWTYLDPKILEYRNGKNVFDGNQTKFIAKHSANVWTSYQVHPAVTVGTGITYVGKRFVDDANTKKLPSHLVWDAMVRWDVNKHVELQANVNNITDTRVYDASHVGIFANVGPGRSYTLNARFKY